jgi:hypothetical protein
MDDLGVHICEPIQAEELANLHEMLSNINIPKAKKGNRKDFEESRYMCFGITRARKSGIIGFSTATRNYPHIWEELKKIGSTLKGRDGKPFTYTSVHVNYNVVCPPHKDKGNIGPSILLGMGDYIGGELCTEDGMEYDINCQPILFNGSQITHWNKPLKNKGKISIVYYVHKHAFNAKYFSTNYLNI